MRYALEEAQYGYDKWNKWDVLHLVRYLIQTGAKMSINHTGNSAVACVLRHVRDWDVCYELLNMLLHEGGNVIKLILIIELQLCCRESERSGTRRFSAFNGLFSSFNQQRSPAPLYS